MKRQLYTIQEIVFSEGKANSFLSFLFQFAACILFNYCSD